MSHLKLIKGDCLKPFKVNVDVDLANEFKASSKRAKSLGRNVDLRPAIEKLLREVINEVQALSDEKLKVKSTGAQKDGALLHEAEIQIDNPVTHGTA